MRLPLTKRDPLATPALGALFAGWAALATWPLALHLDSYLPIGAEAPPTVALFNLWTLRWNADRLLAGYAGYWDAPIFAPARGAFALSEPQPLTGLLYAPLLLVAQSDVLAYNLLLLLILALNGAAMYQLLREAGLARGPALLGGLLAESLPFVAYELGVIQLTVLFPACLALAALLRFAERGDLRSGLGLGGWLAATFLTCEYYGAFLGLLLVFGAPLLLIRAGLGRSAIGNLLIGAALAALLLAPVLPAQARYAAGYTRSDTTIADNSARPADYLRLPAGALGAGAAPWLRDGGGNALYPGTLAVLIGLAGAGAAWRSGRRRWALFCTAGAVGAALLSLGLNLRLAGFAPYELVRAYVPGYRQLRSPFRLAVLAQLLLVALAAEALGWLWRWRAPLGRWCALGLVALGLAEVLILPAPLYRFPAERIRDPWVSRLAAQPAGVVAMVPFPSSGAARDYEPTSVAMLQGLAHGHPLANGYSGFFPPAYVELRQAMQDFPSPASLDALRGAGVTYLVVDRAWATAARQAQIDRLGAELRELFADDRATVYRLAGAAAR